MEDAMQTRAISLIIIVLFFLFTHAFTVTLAATHATTIRIDKPIHFVAPNGDNVVVPAGGYTIEVTEEWLRLTPGKARDALLLQAQRPVRENGGSGVEGKGNRALARPGQMDQFPSPLQEGGEAMIGNPKFTLSQ